MPARRSGGGSLVFSASPGPRARRRPLRARNRLAEKCSDAIRQILGAEVRVLRLTRKALPAEDGRLKCVAAKTAEKLQTRRRSKRAGTVKPTCQAAAAQPLQPRLPARPFRAAPRPGSPQPRFEFFVRVGGFRRVLNEQFAELVKLVERSPRWHQERAQNANIEVLRARCTGNQALPSARGAIRSSSRIMMIIKRKERSKEFPSSRR